MFRFKRIHRKSRPDRRPFILAYHRIQDLPLDPWEMAVTPANFERQIKAVAEHTGGEITPAIFQPGQPQVYITFDDGYSDNYEYALPILKKFKVQATFFLATGFLGCGQEYWWDRLERIFLTPGRLPDVLDAHVQEDHFRFPLKQDAVYSQSSFDQHRSWRPWEKPPTMRHLIYNTLWTVLHRADRAYQDAMIAGLEEWADCASTPRSGNAPLTTQQVREMVAEGMHVAPHTVNHVSIHHCSPEVLDREVTESRTEVANLAGRQPCAFSYPYGETNVTIQTILEARGFNIACTSQTSPILPQSAPLLAPRIFVGNGSLPFIQSLLP